ncbi:MAG: YciI family protein [Polaromonas sp.]|nr:YciI family protein [Polaromonas sp.]
MQYLCLAYYDPEKMDAMDPADMQALVEALPAKDAALAATGRLVWSGSLEGPKATFGMRPRGGKPQVTDGPYAETKELVGGFFVIEADSREEAIRIASLHPAATLGEHIGWGIEVHPIGTCSVKK